MSHFARNQRRFDQISMSIPTKNPKRYSVINDRAKEEENKKQIEKLAEQFKQRLRAESERLGSQ